MNVKVTHTKNLLFWDTSFDYLSMIFLLCRSHRMFVWVLLVFVNTLNMSSMNYVKRIIHIVCQILSTVTLYKLPPLEHIQYSSTLTRLASQLFSYVCNSTFWLYVLGETLSNYCVHDQLILSIQFKKSHSFSMVILSNATLKLLNRVRLFPYFATTEQH